MDYNRLKKVLRWNIIGYKPQLWRFFTTSIVAFSIVTLSQCIGDWFSHEDTVYGINHTAGISLIAYLIILLICASRVCFNMRTKTECITYSMLPATKAEKFTANVIYETFLVLIISIAGFIMVDVVQAIISLLTTHSMHSLTLVTLTQFFDLFTFRNIAALSVIILAHSTYILGGAFFRKHQFLWTSFSILAFNSIVGIIVSSIFAVFAWSMNTNGYDVSIEWFLDDNTTIIFLTIFTLAIAVLFYYLAYRTFCRIQVINKRFFN